MQCAQWRLRQIKGLVVVGYEICVNCCVVDAIKSELMWMTTTLYENRNRCLPNSMYHLTYSALLGGVSSISHHLSRLEAQMTAAKRQNETLQCLLTPVKIVPVSARIYIVFGLWWKCYKIMVLVSDMLLIFLVTYHWC